MSRRRKARAAGREPARRHPELLPADVSRPIVVLHGPLTADMKDHLQTELPEYVVVTAAEADDGGDVMIIDTLESATIREIRQHWPGAVVIVRTAIVASPEQHAAAFNAGADRVLELPSSQTLVAHVRAIVRRRDP